MTSAKPKHLEARRLLLDHLDLHPGRTVHADLDPLEAGVVGDTAHAEGGDSYHLGRDKIRARGSRSRYSVDESSRDQRGLDDHASAMDIGYFQVTTGAGAFNLYDFNAWLIGLCKTGDPDTADLREVIYSPDGRTVRRWDVLGRRSTGDSSHLTHTHLSEFRDADGHRMVSLARRWLQHIGLLPTEDDMTKAEFTAWMTEWAKSPAGADALARAVLNTDGIIPAPAGSKNADGSVNTHWGAWSFLRWGYEAAVSARTYSAAASAGVARLAGQDGVDEQAIVAGVLAGLDPQVIAQAIPQELAGQVADELAARLRA